MEFDDGACGMSDHDAVRTSQRLARVPVRLSVQVCQRNLKLSQLLQWTMGSVIEFDQPTSSTLLLQIDKTTVGSGVAVKTGSQFGLCLQQLGPALPTRPASTTNAALDVDSP